MLSVCKSQFNTIRLGIIAYMILGFFVPFFSHNHRLQIGNNVPLITFISSVGLCFGLACNTKEDTDQEYENIPPYSPIVTFSPLTPSTDDTIQATLLFDTEDPDGDPVSLFYTWYKDGVEQQINGNEVSSSLTNKGEVWSISAHTSDGSLESSIVQVSTTIRNTAPEIVNIAYDSLTPTSVENIEILDIQTTDADDDNVYITIVWYQDGQLIPDLENSYTIPAEYTQKGQEWTAEITPKDTEEGEMHTLLFTIQNTQPVVQSVLITPAEARTDSSLFAEIIASDDDQDELSYIYDWQINNSSFASSELLEGSSFVRGDLIRLFVSADDGTDSSVPVQSQPIIISNSPPQINTVSITPSTAYTNDALTCETIGNTDLDGDVLTTSYEWFVNNNFIKTGNTLGPEYFQKNDDIECQTTISDLIDEDTGSTSITIQNSAPIAQTISLTTPVTTEDILYCEIESIDIDNDIIIHEYKWYVDGIEIPHGNSFLNATHPSFNLQPDNEIFCTVTPSDATQSGNMLTSNTSVLLPAYIELSGTLYLQNQPVSGVLVEADTNPILESISSDLEGTYSLSIPTLSNAMISPMVENMMAPQIFSVDIVQGAIQNQDIVFEDSSFPTDFDLFEPDNGFSNSANFAASMQSSNISINAPLQYRTLFPAGEEDWITVALSNQESYSFISTFLHHTNNIFFFVYDDQGNQIGTSSAYLGNDSIMYSFSPPHTGDYFIKIDTLESNDIASYMFGLFHYVDDDLDGHISFYDCDDNNASIHPEAIEIYQDNVDQNCDGIDPSIPQVLDDTEALGVNHFEPISFQGTQPINPIYGTHSIYSLHNSSDIDRFTVSIPAKSKVEITNSLLEDTTIRIEVLDNNLLQGSYTSEEDVFLFNTSSINKTLTVYVRNNIVGTPVNYSLYALNYGTDNDLDGYYSEDSNALRDNNDSDPTIHP